MTIITGIEGGVDEIILTNKIALFNGIIGVSVNLFSYS
jgi:hypothetical protein